MMDTGPALAVPSGVRLVGQALGGLLLLSSPLLALAPRAAPTAVEWPAARTSSCPENTFKSSLDDQLCAGLTPRPGVTTVEACQELCCSVAFGQCGVWQWCNNPNGGCNEWTGVRCHTGPVNNGDCPRRGNWIGGSRRPAPPPAPPPPAAVRRQGFSGFLGQNFSCNDSQALGLYDSWYYTWTKNPSQYNDCPFARAPQELAREFVPMINGIGQAGDASQNEHSAVVWHDANAHYLLGYNEPDPGRINPVTGKSNHPHIVDPAVAAQDWVEVQALAEQTSLKLISPAMSTTGLDDDGVSPWLDAFFGNCSAISGCDSTKLEGIAFHDYNGNISNLLRRAEGLSARYGPVIGQPGGARIWITEFAINKWACDCVVTRAMQDAYMTEVLPALDRHPAIERYAWYTARDNPEEPGGIHTPVGGGNLLAYGVTIPTLTSTGTVYRTHAVGPASCGEALEGLCGTAPKFPSSQACAMCTGRRQHALRAAGCTAEHVNAFCHS